ncbi:coiled-coil domain-containing protein 180 [Rhinophrynus dorsalis]
MAAVGEVHVVPSGKVYRQLFDAEVQLVRSLGETRARAVQRGTSLESGKISQIRDVDGHTARRAFHSQNLWLDTFPNDHFIENSALYREKNTVPVKKTEESEDAIAAREVRGLCDVIVPEKKDTGIVQRIAAHRREKHDITVSKLQMELAEITKVEMESLVLEAGRSLQQNISASDTKVQQLFQRLESSNSNTTFTLNGLNRIWDEVAEESSYRRQCIRDTERTLLDLEEKRANRITEVLRKYTTHLKEICHLMPPDVDRYIHKEAMMINQAILANHRAIAKLSINLMEADLKRESEQRFQWQDLIKVWKCNQRENIMQNFRVFAEDVMKQIPVSVKEEVGRLMTLRKSIGEKTLQLLYSIRNTIPPTCTETKVTDWYNALSALMKHAESLHKQFLHKLQSLQEEALLKCVAEAENCQEQLLRMNICTNEEAEKILAKESRFLKEQVQIRYQEEQGLWEKTLMNISKQTDLQINDVFRFSAKAVNLWSALQSSLSQQEKTLQEKLNECRQKYEGENKAKESNLDMILDRLRQESTVGNLRTTLGKALLSLQDIKDGYKKFHCDQVLLVDLYPAMVLKELISYSSALSNYFGVKEVYGQGLLSNMDEHETYLTSSSNKSKEKAKTPPGKTRSVNSRLVICSERAEDDLSQEVQQLNDLSLKKLEPWKDSTLNPSQEPVVGYADAVMFPTFKTECKEAAEEARSQSPQRIQPDNTNEPMSERNKEQHHLTFENDSVDLEHPEISESDESSAGQKALEIFITSRGNKYSVLPSGPEDEMKPKYHVEEQSETENIFMTEAASEDKTLNLDLMVISEDVFTDLKKSIRLGFYEHLEQWFDESISGSHGIVIAKKEELKLELDLLNRLHEPRSQHIEMDIHNVRAAELLLHSERVNRHCDGVNQALSQLKNESSSLIEKMKQETLRFHNKISAMEKTFLNANKSEKLISLTKSLSSILDSHVSGVKTTLRNYRQEVEERLGSLCDTNSDLIKSFRLFSEGGNFSPDEVETYRKKLHKASDTIASFEGSIMVDLEGLESMCIDQATDTIKKFEEKFIILTTDTIFLENIQKLMTNLQVKIKTLVANSNFQTQQINSYLEQLRKKTDACAHPNMDKESVTAEKLYSFVATPMDEVIKRSIYLSCLLEPSPLLSKATLQGPIATAASRLESPLRQETKAAFMTPDNLLNPSRIGKLALDDSAVSVIKNIIKTQQSVGDLQQDREDPNTRHSPVTGLRQNLPIAPHPPVHPIHGKLKKKKKVASVDGENGNQLVVSASTRKLIKPSRFDKKYQVFGERREESKNFKGIVTSILWESNDTLLYLAEEFYKKKERRTTGRPDLLQETFEECADMLVLKLQSYEKQTLEYHNNCLLEFREQLEKFEKLLSEVPPLVIESHRRQHLETMRTETAQIRQLFSKDLHNWDSVKEKMRSLLRPNLGHPECCHLLEEMCKQEELRQKEECEGIDINTKHLQSCVSSCTEYYITSLASLTEKILLELDESLTADDISPAKTEIPKETLSTLIRRKQAGLPLENTVYKPLIERGSRVWPGIALVDPTGSKCQNTNGCQETASVTTAKTTLGHVSTVEARDSAYLKFLLDAEAELSNIHDESRQQHLAAQRWKEWWLQSVQEIKGLYM